MSNRADGAHGTCVYLETGCPCSLNLLKQQGNDKFKAGDIDGARRIYSEALDQMTCVETKHDIEIRQCQPYLELKTALLNNRGLMHLKMKSYFAAIRDLTNCITLCRIPNAVSHKPSYLMTRYSCTLGTECKALYRRSLVYRTIDNLSAATRDVCTVIGLLGEDMNNEISPDIASLAQKDMYELPNYKRPTDPVAHQGCKTDRRLNYFGAGWKLVWKDGRRKERVHGHQGHTAVFWNKAIYVLAGKDIEHMFVGTFEMFDLTSKTWKRLPVPCGCIAHLYGHSAVVWRDAMYVLGGDNKNDVWQYNFKTKVWKKFPVKGCVPSLIEHTACVLEDTMYVFGGTGQLDGREIEHCNNLYSLHFPSKRWHKLSGTDDRNPYVEGVHLPEPRYNHTMWPDVSRKRIYILGGSMRRPNTAPASRDPLKFFNYEYNNTTLNDFWCYDIDKGVWMQEELYGNAPVSRCEYSAAVTSRGAVMFGGFTTSVYSHYKAQNDRREAISISSYLCDTFEFVSSSDSFCVIHTPENATMPKRAKCILVSDGEDHIYAVHGYHGGFDPMIQGFSDIHVLNLKRTHSVNPKPALKACSSCGKTNNEEKLKKCNGICGGQAWYCSSVCQKKHWKQHRDVCGRKRE